MCSIYSSINRLISLCALLLVIVSTFTHAQTAPNCGTVDSTLAKYLAQYSRKEDLSRARIGSGDKLEYRLALDINYNTYLLYNQDKELIKKVAYKFIEDASKIFERDINVKLTVCSILIWDKPEPYTFTSDTDYYDKVYNYWAQNRFEERDAVVGMSVRYGWFYGGYRMCTSNFPEPDNPSLPVDLLCHELGHTLGSPHTHNCSWPGGPIDYCEILEGSNPECNSPYREYVNGSLMSYCRSVMEFHPLCKNLMRDFSEGKISTEFKLNTLDAPLTTSGLLMINNENNLQSVSNTPAFEWYAGKGVGEFRFQISRNKDFSDLAEDITVKQSYYRSSGLGSGTYFARFTAVNGAGNAQASPVVDFTVPAFSENSTPPLIAQATYSRDGTVTGSFIKYNGTEDLQVEFADEYNGFPPALYNFKMSQNAPQTFEMTTVRSLYTSKVAIRIRVGTNQKWSKWSEKTYLNDPWDSEVWRTTYLSETSSTPVIAVGLYKASIHTGANQFLEIYTDAGFKNTVFKDSLMTNRINSPYSNKVIFNPVLDENSSYFGRTRVSWAQGAYSKWRNFELKTSVKDRRFEFMGLVSENTSTTNYSYGEFLQNRFYTTGQTLYAHAISGGYYTTTDLKNWQPYTTSSTKGRAPTGVYMFAASDDGQSIYLLDSDRRLVKRTANATYEYYTSPQNFYVQSNTQGWISKDNALLFGTETNGMAYFKNGNWIFYDSNTLFSNRVLTTARDRQGRIWAVMDGGYLWSFDDAQWKMEGSFPYWPSLKGITFDEQNQFYLYGDFGLVRSKADQTWEFLYSGFPVRKMVLDKTGQIWLACYRNIDGLTFLDHALLKLKGKDLTVYSTGLNFLREQFDIEIFNDKVAIMTSGGEIHTFDEKQIQGFDPLTNYCSGTELEVSLTTNTPFATDNQIEFELIGADGKSILVKPNGVPTGNKITFNIPDTLAAGAYQLRTLTTNPRIASNISTVFRIATPPRPSISIQNVNDFTTKLSAGSDSNLSYQWKLNGIDIPSETGGDISVFQSGDYSVSVTNAEGCSATSAVTPVEIEEPDEVTLLQNFPNPLFASSEIAFYLPQNQEISLDIFNSKGQKIRQAITGERSKGWHLYKMEGNGLSSGIYIYKLTAGTVSRSLKMVKI